MSKPDIEELEQLIEKHQLALSLTRAQKYRAYAVLARELELYGYLEESLSYYGRSLKNIPRDQDSLEILSSMLSVLYRKDREEALKFYQQKFKKAATSSTSPVKSKILDFWKKVFSKKVFKPSHVGFYGQFFKDQDVKTLMQQKKYSVALSFLDPKALKSADINHRLEYDVLSKIAGKKSGFFCLSTLKKYPNSPSVTMDICRYLKGIQLKVESLETLKKKAAAQLPHLSYLVDALFDIPVEQEKKP
jgi:tetratricopeptide (TPR) repeat protein